MNLEMNTYLNFFFFSIRVFFHRHWRFTGQPGKGQPHVLFHSTTSTCSQILRHLFAALHVRWLSPILIATLVFNWLLLDEILPPYRITIWLTDWRWNVCLFTWWIDSKFLLQLFDMGNRWIWTRIDYHPCITIQANRLTKCASHLKLTFVLAVVVSLIYIHCPYLI